LRTLELPSLPTGVVLTQGTELVVCLQDGLHVVDADAATSELLAAYPDGLYGRANDANADGDGNLVTGTLNLAPGPGSFWSFSTSHGWRLLDEGIGNTNGPLVVPLDGQQTLVLADTLARVVYAYPYDGENARVGDRRVFADHTALDGAPDGATADAAGGVWSCVLAAGKIARFSAGGLSRTIDLSVPNPSDVAFGGPRQDRLFVTSIAVDLGAGPPPPEAAWLLAVDDIGVVGAPEARFRLS
jgi:L-arabinonolactonase